MKKIFLILVLTFLLTSCFNKSNLYEEPENNTNTNSGQEDIKEVKNLEKIEKKIEEISKEELIKGLRTIAGGENIREKMEKLSKFKKPREVDKLLLLKSSVGRYEEVVKEKERYCEKLQRDIYCLKFKANFVVEELTDGNNSRITDKTDLGLEFDGTKLDFNHIFLVNLNYEMNHLLRVYKKGYIGFYNTFYSGRTTPENNFRFKPQVEKYTHNENIGISDSFSHKTENFEFILESDTFAYENGKQVYGNIDLYLFDTKNKDLSIFKLKKFDKETLSYLGKGFNAEAVALVKAYKGNEELKIVKPIKVLSNLNKLVPNYEFSQSIPKDVNLSLEEINKHNIPFIGNLEIHSGNWLSSELKILNNDLDIEFLLN